MAGTPETYLSGLDSAGLRSFVKGLGERPFRAQQVLKAFWKEGKHAYGEVSTLPAEFRETLTTALPLYPWAVAGKQSAPDGTAKFLLEAPDGERVETVCIPSSGGTRRTVCVSTQTGCGVGCLFCATGGLGAGRNLSVAEMAGQVLLCRLELGDISNVVFMGMGEPLLNPDAVLSTVGVIQDPGGLALGKRRVTVSTIGVVPVIRRMAEEAWPVRLAVSLHSADEKIRKRLVPGLSYTPSEIIEAARMFRQATHRTVTVEYVLLGGVNDSKADARALLLLLEGGGFKVNLIPWNKVNDCPFEAPDAPTVKGFEAAVAKGGVPVSVRASAGGDIDAACGQLRARG